MQRREKEKEERSGYKEGIVRDRCRQRRETKRDKETGTERKREGDREG